VVYFLDGYDLAQASRSIIIPFQLDALENPRDNPFSIEHPIRWLFSLISDDLSPKKY